MQIVNISLTLSCWLVVTSWSYPTNNSSTTIDHRASAGHLRQQHQQQESVNIYDDDFANHNSSMLGASALNKNDGIDELFEWYTPLAVILKKASESDIHKQQLLMQQDRLLLRQQQQQSSSYAIDRHQQSPSKSWHHSGHPFVYSSSRSPAVDAVVTSYYGPSPYKYYGVDGESTMILKRIPLAIIQTQYILPNKRYT